MAAKRTDKKKVPTYREMGYEAYGKLWEEYSRASSKAIEHLPANTDHSTWAVATPTIAKASNGTVLVSSEAYAKRKDIFEELRQRAAEPNAFHLELPTEFKCKWENVRRAEKNEIAQLLDKAIRDIEKAFEGCENDDVKVSSSADVEIDEDGYMKTKASVAPHSFEELLKAAVSKLSFSYEHTGDVRNCTGYDKTFEMAMEKAIDDNGSTIETPVIKKGKATFVYWKDYGFNTHTRWQEDWKKYPCVISDIDKAKAFISLRKVAEIYDSMFTTSEKMNAETWAFLPKE